MSEIILLCCLCSCVSSIAAGVAGVTGFIPNTEPFYVKKYNLEALRDQFNSVNIETDEEQKKENCRSARKLVREMSKNEEDTGMILGYSGFSSNYEEFIEKYYGSDLEVKKSFQLCDDILK